MKQQKELKKTLGSETPAAREQLNAETGLAPCPFCGNSLLEEHDDPKLTAIVCGQCGGQLHSGVSLKYAKDRWNKRAPLTAKKDLEGATRTPRGQVSQETGDAPDLITRMKKLLCFIPEFAYDTIIKQEGDPQLLPNHLQAMVDDVLGSEGASLTSSLPQSPTLTEGKEKSVWTRTSERAPAEKDADKDGYIFALFGDEEEKLDVGIFHLSEIKEKGNGYPFWMPIPALPEGVKSA